MWKLSPNKFVSPKSIFAKPSPEIIFLNRKIKATILVLNSLTCKPHTTHGRPTSTKVMGNSLEKSHKGKKGANKQSQQLQT